MPFIPLPFEQNKPENKEADSDLAGGDDEDLDITGEDEEPSH
jgi:hypothetical protein